MSGPAPALGWLLSLVLFQAWHSEPVTRDEALVRGKPSCGRGQADDGQAPEDPRIESGLQFQQQPREPRCRFQSGQVGGTGISFYRTVRMFRLFVEKDQPRRVEAVLLGDESR